MLEGSLFFSIDEQKQFFMAQDYPADKFPQLRFFVGDVRDKDEAVKSSKRM